MRASFVRIASLTVKEFHAVLMDPKSRVQLFIAPFVMLAIFSFAVTMEVKNAGLGVWNQDTGELGRQLVSHFSSGPTFTRVFQLGGTEEIRSLVESQKALAVLSVPEDFSRSLSSGRPASVQLILDGRKVNAAQIVGGYAAQIVRQFERRLAEERPDVVLNFTKNSGTAFQMEVVTRQLYNPNLVYIWFTLPVLLVILTQLIALIVSSMSVARERELGTFEQLMVSPLSSVEIVIGKAVPAAFIAFCEGVVIHEIAGPVFGVPFTGSLPLLALAFGLFILSVTGVGLFISSLCQTQQQAFLGCFTYMVPAVLLSGFAAPVENMHSFLNRMTLLNPARHIIAVTLEIYLKGVSLEVILPELAWLSGIAAATLVFAGWFFKRRTQ